jgi:hypothetical protein
MTPGARCRVRSERKSLRLRLVNPLAFENAGTALGDLREDAGFLALERSCDAAFHQLAREVRVAMTQCFQWEPNPPTEHEISERLDRMLAMCVGDSARFRPHIERAQAAFHEA